MFFRNLIIVAFELDSKIWMLKARSNATIIKKFQYSKNIYIDHTYICVQQHIYYSAVTKSRYFGAAVVVFVQLSILFFLSRFGLGSHVGAVNLSIQHSTASLRMLSEGER